MHTVGTVLLRKFVCDFAIVAEILKDELANPKIGPDIKDEVMTLGNQAVSQLNALEKIVKLLFESDSEPDATGDSSQVANQEESK